jgi:hypothetical protein
MPQEIMSAVELCFQIVASGQVLCVLLRYLVPFDG